MEGVEGALKAVERYFKWSNSYSGYEAPKIIMNAKGELTNGKFTLNIQKMMKHMDGTAGKSQFLYDVDANKAKVYIENGPVGVTGSGDLTNYINVYRTKAGTVHGCPGNP